MKPQPNQSNASDESQAYTFVLRVWTDNGDSWRASLHLPGTGARRVFVGLDELLAHLVHLTQQHPTRTRRDPDSSLSLPPSDPSPP